MLFLSLVLASAVFAGLTCSGWVTLKPRVLPTRFQAAFTRTTAGGVTQESGTLLVDFQKQRYAIARAPVFDDGILIAPRDVVRRLLKRMAVDGNISDSAVEEALNATPVTLNRTMITMVDQLNRQRYEITLPPAALLNSSASNGSADSPRASFNLSKGVCLMSNLTDSEEVHATESILNSLDLISSNVTADGDMHDVAQSKENGALVETYTRGISGLIYHVRVTTSGGDVIDVRLFENSSRVLHLLDDTDSTRQLKCIHTNITQPNSTESNATSPAVAKAYAEAITQDDIIDPARQGAHIALEELAAEASRNSTPAPRGHRRDDRYCKASPSNVNGNYCGSDADPWKDGSDPCHVTCRDELSQVGTMNRCLACKPSTSSVDLACARHDYCLQQNPTPSYLSWCLPQGNRCSCDFSLTLAAMASVLGLQDEMSCGGNCKCVASAISVVFQLLSCWKPVRISICIPIPYFTCGCRSCRCPRFGFRCHYLTISFAICVPLGSGKVDG